MKPEASDSRSIFDLTETNHKEQLTVQEEAVSLRGTGLLSVSDRLNNSTLLQWSIGALAVLAITRHFFIKSQGLDINITIFIFLTLGLILHKTPMRFIIAMKRACANMSGIIYQYPCWHHGHHDVYRSGERCVGCSGLLRDRPDYSGYRTNGRCNH